MNPQNKSPQQTSTIIILCCFFISGALSLVYEILWIKKLGLVFGTTVFALTSVLATFFGGLALGSFILGKVSDKVKNPIKIYAVLELLIAVFAILFPTLLNFAGYFFELVYPFIYTNFFVLTLVRFVLFSILLIIPTTLMGGTLPLVSRHFINSTRFVGSTFGFLYGINTAGAVVGAVICGFFGIRLFGVAATTYYAALINISIAVIAFFCSRLIIAQIDSDRSPSEVEGSIDREVPFDFAQGADTSSFRKHRTFQNSVLIPISFFLSGFASIGYEVVWTRYISLPLANTRYTYTIIIIVFLIGNAIGSLVSGKYFSDIKNETRFFGLLEIAIGLFAFLLVPLFYLFATKAHYSLFGSDFILCGILMLIPTIIMGATFPLVIKILTAQNSGIGYSIGKCYAINTFGCILGSLITGFLLLPYFGLKTSLNILVGINLFIGFISLVANAKKNLIALAVSTAFVVLTVTVLPMLIQIKIPDDFLSTFKAPNEQIALVKEGLENTVWTTTNPLNQQQSIWVNRTVLGRTLAIEPYKVSPQIIAGHVPLLLHQGVSRSVLGICLGTGQTFGSMLSYPIDKLDIVELSKTIVNVSREQFKISNNSVCEDSRTNIIVEDGRNFVFNTKNKYDIIALEPPPPEEAGIVNLYSVEFYRASKKRLNKNGILSQWLPIYCTAPQETRKIIKTFISVFPNTILWYNSADLILVGFANEISLDPQSIQMQLSSPVVAKDLSLSYIDNNLPNFQESSIAQREPYNLTGTIGFFAGFLMGPKELYSFTKSEIVITDNNSDLEYSYIKYETLRDKQDWLVIYNTDSLKNYLSPLSSFLPGIAANTVSAIETLRSRYLSQLYADVYVRRASALFATNPQGCIDFCKKALEYNQDYGLAHYKLGDAYRRVDNTVDAIRSYENAAREMPIVMDIWQKLIDSYTLEGRIAEAENAQKRAIEIQKKFTN